MQCCGSTNSTHWANGKMPHSCFQKSITNNYTHYTIYNQVSDNIERIFNKLLMHVQQNFQTFKDECNTLYIHVTTYMYYCFSKECGEVLEEWTKENLLIIGWGGFSFSVVQVSIYRKFCLYKPVVLSVYTDRYMYMYVCLHQSPRQKIIKVFLKITGTVSHKHI